MTLWWHRETPSITVLIDDDAETEFQYIKKKLLSQNIDVTILDIKNDLGVYVAVCILKQNEYPVVTYGSAAHIDFKSAVKHALYEAVSCIAGLRYEFIHFKQYLPKLEYPDFIKDNSETNLSDYKRNLNLEKAINRYDIYYSYIVVEDGFLVKAYCFELQPTLYCETVPLTKRFFLANTNDVRIKENFPFL